MYYIETIETIRGAAINKLIHHQKFEYTARNINVKGSKLKQFIMTTIKRMRIEGKIMKVTNAMSILGTLNKPIHNPNFVTKLIQCIIEYERPKQGRKPNKKTREENTKKWKNDHSEVQTLHLDRSKHGIINVENNGDNRMFVGNKEGKIKIHRWEPKKNKFLN